MQNTSYIICLISPDEVKVVEQWVYDLVGKIGRVSQLAGKLT